MANQLSMDKTLAISHLNQQGMSQRAIATALGVSRGAVIRHLQAQSANGTKAPTGSTAEAPTGSEISNSTTAPTGSATIPLEEKVDIEAIDQAPRVAAESTAHRPSRSRCAPFHEIILEKLEQGLDSQRIYQDLVEDYGYQEKYWSVNRYVKSLGKAGGLPFRRLETEAGWELQVDFGTGRPCPDASGQVRKTYVFRAVLSHSRKGYTEVVRRMTTENFIRSLENCFWRLGGVPKTVVFDNAKCAVIKADWYDPQLHPKIVDFCKHYGFALLPTRPATPRHKGKVERGVDYVQENALKGRSFESLEQQNAHLERWEQSVADTRIHGTTKRQVRESFELERSHLQPVARERFPFYHEGQRRVSRDGHISVNRAYYSVGPEYLGCDVWVRWNSQTVRILDHRLEQIALHCTQEAGRFSTQAEHLDPRKTHTIERGVEYLLRKVSFLGPSAVRWAEAAVEARGIEASRTIQGLLSLSRKFDSAQINQACQIAWGSNCYTYRAIKRLLEQQAASQQETMEFMDDHPVIRSITEYGDFIKRAIQGGCT